MAQTSQKQVADSNAVEEQAIAVSVPTRKVSAETIKLKEVIMQTFPHGFDHGGSCSCYASSCSQAPSAYRPTEEKTNCRCLAPGFG